MGKNIYIKPYEHDCTECKWVGWCSQTKRLSNVYICKGETVILRFSDKPGDYWSMSVGCVKEAVLVTTPE